MTKKIYINRGHSNSDPGAVGYVTERKVAVKVGDYMVDYLKNNYTCSIKESKGSVGSLTAITTEANNWDADLFVSIHFNAGGGDGYEALVYGSSRKSLGECFEKHVKSVGQNSRGVKYRPDLAVLKLTNMPSILNEIAFVDNKNDIKDWNEDSELKVMGQALAKAAAEYLNLSKKSTSSTPKYKALQDLNFRKTASLKGEAICIIPKGTTLTGTVDSNGWLKTTYKNKTGYVRQKGSKVYCQKL